MTDMKGRLVTKRFVLMLTNVPLLKMTVSQVLTASIFQEASTAHVPKVQLEQVTEIIAVKILTNVVMVHATLILFVITVLANSSVLVTTIYHL